MIGKKDSKKGKNNPDDRFQEANRFFSKQLDHLKGNRMAEATLRPFTTERIETITVVNDSIPIIRLS